MSSLMDAIQGGGAPMGPGPMGPGPGAPPDLAAMLGGMGGPPPEPELEESEPAGDTQSVIRQMIDLARGYLDVEDDDQEKAQMAAVLKTLQDFLAREQKEVDDAMGGRLSPRLMRKSFPSG